jgi:hypothetical protein
MAKPRGRPSPWSEEHRERARVLLEEGLSLHATAQRIGVPLSTVRSWAKRGNWIAAPPPQEGSPPDTEVGAPLTPPDDPERIGAPASPRRPPGGKIQPVELDYGSLQEYIEGAYKLAGQTVRTNDPYLGDAIDEHAHKAGVAWCKWVRSEPKVAALLQRLMIGTPLGEVIGVHVSIVFAYVLARGAAREFARAQAAAESGNGAGAASSAAHEPAPDQLA